MPGGVEDSAGRDGSAESFALAFSGLNVARRQGHASPHKPCMLLALIDPAEAGDLDENVVRYEPALLERYDQPGGLLGRASSSTARRWPGSAWLRRWIGRRSSCEPPPRAEVRTVRCVRGLSGSALIEFLDEHVR